MTNSLIERLEKLTGPDREVDNDILRACGWTIKTNMSGGTGSATSIWWRDPNGEYFPDGCQPNPTESIDAALTLMPKMDPGCIVELVIFGDRSASAEIGWDDDKGNTGRFTAGAKSAANAIAAASLRARAALEDKERG